MAAEIQALHHGLRLAQRYQLAERVDRGALAIVYRGQDLVLRRPIAVKAVPPEHIEAYRTALRESSTLAHPSAICVYDALVHDGWLFVVQEYVAARPISDYFGPGVPTERAVELGRQIAGALAHAHTHGVVHGDLTPTAVLVDRSANVRLNNFSLPPDTAYFARMAAVVAASLQADDPTVEMPAAADASYPLAQGVPDASTLLTPAGDTRAVGYLLWQALSEPVITATGTEPDEGMRRFRAEVPSAVREVVVQCIAASVPQPIDDPQTLALALERLSLQLSQTRPASPAATPPAVLAARSAAHNVAWSAEETVQGGRRLWSAAHPAARPVPEQAPRSADMAGARAAHAVSADRPPPLPISVKEGGTAQALDEAPVWAAANAQVHDQAYDRDPRRSGLPLIAVLLLGTVLFILFFLVGYFSGVR